MGVAGFRACAPTFKVQVGNGTDAVPMKKKTEEVGITKQTSAGAHVRVMKTALEVGIKR